jgi:hypothetical protein
MYRAFLAAGFVGFYYFEDAIETRNAFVHRGIPSGQTAEFWKRETELGSCEAGAGRTRRELFQSGRDRRVI